MAQSRQRGGWTGSQALAAWTGGVIAVVALLAPAGYLSVRLLEDAGLFFVAAPLLLAGTPAWLPRGPLLRPGVAGTLRLLTRPLPAVLIFHVLFAVSLLPPALAAERAGAPLLAGVRLVLLAAALLMWRPLLNPTQALPRLGATMQLVYIFINWLAITGVFGWLLFSGSSAYGPAGVFGLSPEQDRQAGAFALGLVSHIAYAVIGITVFVRWVRAEQALVSPLHLYARVRRAGFDEREAGDISGMAGRGR